MALNTQPRSYQKYTIGWICVLEPELVAAKAMLDEEYEEKIAAIPGDTNDYSFGRIGKHHVVIASLPSGTYGTNSAAVVATQMSRSFQDLRFCLLVGVGGGVPQMSTHTSDDIRLGDVVVSNPIHQSGGVIQYDLGRMYEGERRPKITGTLNKPPALVLKVVTSLKANHRLKESPLESHFVDMARRYPGLIPEYSYQGTKNDILFEVGYKHKDDITTCVDCDQSKTVNRESRKSNQPRIHYGTIASGNQVVKDTVTREFWRKEAGVLCFEMEAAGLMEEFPCLVIRGICDYADSHKNKIWQPYAAVAAAAYAKDLLLLVAPTAVQAAETPLKPGS